MRNLGKQVINHVTLLDGRVHHQELITRTLYVAADGTPRVNGFLGGYAECDITEHGIRWVSIVTTGRRRTPEEIFGRP